MSEQSDVEQDVPRDKQRWMVVPGELDDDWGIRREGEPEGMSIAQMVWDFDAREIVAAHNAALRGGTDALAMLADRQGVPQELCPTCHHPVSMVYRGLCFGLVDGSTDWACGCRAIGPDGKFYPDEVRAWTSDEQKPPTDSFIEVPCNDSECPPGHMKVVPVVPPTDLLKELEGLRDGLKSGEVGPTIYDVLRDVVIAKLDAIINRAKEEK